MPTNVKLEKLMGEKGYITVREAAQRSSVSIYTVYKRLKQGSLKGAKVDGHRFVLASSLATYHRSTSDEVGAKLKVGDVV